MKNNPLLRPLLSVLAAGCVLAMSAGRAAAAAEILVEESAAEIPDAGNKGFGPVLVGSSNLLTFTIKKIIKGQTNYMICLAV